MNYKEEVLKIEPTAKSSWHCLGEAEWWEIRKSPYESKDELGCAHLCFTDDSAWIDAYNKLTKSSIPITTDAGPGGYDYHWPF